MGLKKVKSKEESFKCPLCGNDEFISESWDDYSDGGYFHRGTSYSCSECGYMFLINDNIVRAKTEARESMEPLFNELKEAISVFNKEVSGYEEKINELKNRAAEIEEEFNDRNRTVARDEELREEYQELDITIADLNKKIKRLEENVKSVKQKAERELSHMNNSYASQQLSEELRKILSKFKKR